MLPGNVNWTTIDGTCGGRPVQLLDPRGGNTAFLLGGSVLVGKIFTAINNDTGQVLDQTVTGRGIDEARLITCVFLFPDTTIPGLGTIDLRFEVEALPTPQGGEAGSRPLVAIRSDTWSGLRRPVPVTARRGNLPDRINSYTAITAGRTVRGDPCDASGR